MSPQPSPEIPGSKLLIPARFISFRGIVFPPLSDLPPKREHLSAREREIRSTVIQIFQEANGWRKTGRGR